MKKLIARIRVLVKAAPTYLVGASVVVTAVTEEVAESLSGDAASNVVRWGGRLVALIGAATAIVRRVTPVLASQSGLLGPEVETVTVGPSPEL